MICEYCQGTGRLGFQQEDCWYCDGLGHTKTNEPNEDKNKEVLMSFGDVLSIVKENPWNKVARKEWNDKGRWIHLNIPSTSPFSGDKNRFEPLPYLEIKTVDDKFMPWLPSQADILAEDWIIVSKVSMLEG